MKLKLVAAFSALAIPALAHAEQSAPQPAVLKPTKADAQEVVQIVTTNDKVAQNSAADADLDEDFSIVTGLSGGPTSYLDGIKKMPWVIKLLDKCDLDEQRIRESATSAFMRTKLGFVRSDVSDFFERPLFQLVVTALPASSGCAASISARVIAPIEEARFVYDKKPLQKPTIVTIWESQYGEGGRVIYEPHDKITASIEATIDTLINEFAEAWTHSQGIGHPKYGAP